MVNSTVKLMHANIAKALQDICDIYKSCEKCPYRADAYSTVYLDGTMYATGCTQILMLRAFEHNELKED